MPKRFVEPAERGHGLLGTLGATVTRRPLPIFIVGVVIVASSSTRRFHINPSDAELARSPVGRRRGGRAAITASGIPDGVYLPYVVVAEGDVTQRALVRVASAARRRIGSTAPPRRRRGAAEDRVSSRRSAGRRQLAAAKKTISQLRDNVLPAAANGLGARRRSRSAARRPRRGLHQRRVRELPVRHPVRPPADVRAAHARVPLGRAAAQGR
jgi:hypothetical protein